MTDFDDRLNTSWWVLRIGLGVGPIITGTDKFFNKLTDWGMYLSPVVTKIVPVSAATFMHIVGAIEIIAVLGCSQPLDEGWKLFGDVLAAWNRCQLVDHRHVL